MRRFVCVCSRYVEQSNIFLEQRNESLQQSSSYSQSKLVQLEREKVIFRLLSLKCTVAKQLMRFLPVINQCPVSFVPHFTFISALEGTQRLL
jgi:hypothetical protein